MTLRIHCRCGAVGEIPDAAAGHAIRCRACRRVLRIPKRGLDRAEGIYELTPPVDRGLVPLVSTVVAVAVLAPLVAWSGWLEPLRFSAGTSGFPWQPAVVIIGTGGGYVLLLWGLAAVGLVPATDPPKHVPGAPEPSWDEIFEDVDRLSVGARCALGIWLVGWTCVGVWLAADFARARAPVLSVATASIAMVSGVVGLFHVLPRGLRRSLADLLDRMKGASRRR